MHNFYFLLFCVSLVFYLLMYNKFTMNNAKMGGYCLFKCFCKENTRIIKFCIAVYIVSCQFIVAKFDFNDSYLPVGI